MHTHTHNDTHTDTHTHTHTHAELRVAPEEAREGARGWQRTGLIVIAVWGADRSGAQIGIMLVKTGLDL